MNKYHWLSMLLIFAIGYAAARFFPQIGNKVGLPSN